jgi:hypothetical protein
MSENINNTNIDIVERVNNFFEVLGYIVLTIISSLIILYSISISRIKFECCDKFLRWIMKYHPNTRINNTIEINHPNPIEINLSNPIEVGEIINCNEIQFDNCCAICLELLNQENIFKVKCNHCFHLECWDQWEKATMKVVCPVCRFEI